MEQKTSNFSRLDSRAGSRIGKSLFSLKTQTAQRQGTRFGPYIRSQTKENDTSFNFDNSGQIDVSVTKDMAEINIDGTASQSTKQIVATVENLFKNDEEDFEFEEATAEFKIDSYLDRVTKDFDQRKSYEEMVLRVLNFYQRSP